MEIEKITCSKLGINGIREIIGKYKMLSEDVEQELIENEKYEILFFHNLVYPYGVARKYYIHWIPKEELIDESIIGFRKGLDKYLRKKRAFRIGDYVVHWCQNFCIKKIVKSIWELSERFEERNIPKSDLDGIIFNIKNGSFGQSKFLKEYYFYLFEEIDKKYLGLGILLDEETIDEVIRIAINRNFSLEELEEDNYESYRSQLGFEDIILLEYSLAYQNEIKKNS